MLVIFHSEPKIFQGAQTAEVMATRRNVFSEHLNNYSSVEIDGVGKARVPAANRNKIGLFLPRVHGATTAAPR